VECRRPVGRDRDDAGGGRLDRERRRGGGRASDGLTIPRMPMREKIMSQKLLRTTRAIPRELRHSRYVRLFE